MVSTVRRAVESQYTGICTITEYRERCDEVTKITSHHEVDVLTDVPCRLSYNRIDSAKQSESAAVAQSIKLFIAPEIVIKPGSKISVTQNGVTNAYKNSGMPAVHSTHQEIMLELFSGWS